MTASLAPLLPRPAAALFDYGGTLVRFERPDTALDRAYAEIAAQLTAWGFPPIPPSRLLTEVHDRVEDAAVRHQMSGALEEIDLVAEARSAYLDLGAALDDAQIDAVLAIEQRAWWQGIRVDPDAVPVLTALRDAGVRVGLCSNAPYRHASLIAQLQYLKLASCFDAVTFSGAVGWRKPSLRIFQAALQALDVAASDAVMIGDSRRDDIEGARAAGLRSILLAPQASQQETSTPADRTIRSLREAIPVILGTTGV